MNNKQLASIAAVLEKLEPEDAAELMRLADDRKRLAAEASAIHAEIAAVVRLQWDIWRRFQDEHPDVVRVKNPAERTTPAAIPPRVPPTLQCSAEKE